MLGVALVVVGFMPPVPINVVQDAEAREGSIFRMIRRLGDDSFPEREAATRQLLRLGRDALPVLVRAREQTDCLETLRRLEQLLSEIGPVVPGNPTQVNGIRAVLSLSKSRYRVGEALDFQLALRKVDATAPLFAALERVQEPIERTSVTMRHFLEEKPRIKLSNSPADAEVVIVQLTGELIPSVIIHSCGAERVKLRDLTKVLRKGPRTDVFLTQKISINQLMEIKLAPGRYEAHLVYDAKKHGAKEDLRSNVVTFFVEKK